MHDELTLRELGNFVIFLGGVCGAILTIGVMLRFLIVRPIIKQLDQRYLPTIKETHAAAQQLKPNGGDHLADKVNEAVEHARTAAEKAAVTDQKLDLIVRQGEMRELGYLEQLKKFGITLQREDREGL